MPRNRSHKSAPGTTQPTSPSTFTDHLPLPSLIVFDLDYTLWPFWVDTHVSGPLKPTHNNTAMIDRYGEHCSFYPQVPGILAAAKEGGITMGLASRTSAPELAREMLRGLCVDVPVPESEKGSKLETKPTPAINLFAHQQIYPGSKTTHFRRIHAATKQQSSGKEGGAVDYKDILFFDDEQRNVNVQTELGVTFWLVRDGVTVDEVDAGVREWRRRRGIGRTQNGGVAEGTSGKDEL